ncbi:MAG: tRNA dihydrouridine synthase DusB [Bacteroidales bacterium]
MKIGDITLDDKPLFLAPMEDITDPSFRFICKQFGADVMYTEFISSDGLIRDARKSLEKLSIYDYERPIGIQLYGHLVDAMVESAKIAETGKPDFIDLNFGCPVKKIARRGAGAGLLCNVPLMVEMTKAVVKAVKLPVTVKTRLGWDDENKNIMDIAERLQDAGIKALAIHGRTKAQLYKGTADWQLIGEVKNNPRISIPIIGNGDIVTPQGAVDAFEKYGVDAIMIGRAAVGVPWLFRDIKTLMSTGSIPDPPSVKEKVALAKRHFNKSLEIKGEKVGVYEMRRHFSNYFKGLENFRETRLKLLTENDPEQIFRLLEEIKEKWG